MGGKLGDLVGLDHRDSSGTAQGREVLRRYLVFAGAAYYADGGAGDLKTSADSVEEARSWLLDPARSEDYLDEFHWCHVLDLVSGRVVLYRQGDYCGNLSPIRLSEGREILVRPETPPDEIVVPNIQPDKIVALDYGDGPGTVSTEKLPAGVVGEEVSAPGIDVTKITAWPSGLAYDPINIILNYADQIRNGRNIKSIFRHLRDDEMVEIEDEVEAWDSGAGNTDRVVAECMDGIACLVDITYTVCPGVRSEQLCTTAEALGQRWRDKYSESHSKPDNQLASSRRT